MGVSRTALGLFLWGSRAETGPAAEFGLRAVTLYFILSIGDLVRTIGGGDTFVYVVLSIGDLVRTISGGDTFL